MTLLAPLGPAPVQVIALLIAALTTVVVLARHPRPAPASAPS